MVIMTLQDPSYLEKHQHRSRFLSKDLVAVIAPTENRSDILSSVGNSSGSDLTQVSDRRAHSKEADRTHVDFMVSTSETALVLFRLTDKSGPYVRVQNVQCPGSWVKQCKAVLLDSLAERPSVDSSERIRRFLH
jgi:hypothetical protein